MSIYLRSFQLKEEYRGIKPFKVTFREGLNVVVGENGAGKSSMLGLICPGPYSNGEEKKLIELDFVSGSKFKFFDTEKNNPRIKSDCSHSKNIQFEIAARFMSHGQTMLPMMEASEGFKSILLVVDEPEAGISLSNQKKVLVAFNKAISNDCQVIISTHSYILINSVEKVFSMDSKRWVSSKTYLKKVLT